MRRMDVTVPPRLPEVTPDIIGAGRGPLARRPIVQRDRRVSSRQVTNSARPDPVDRIMTSCAISDLSDQVIQRTWPIFPPVSGEEAVGLT